MSINRIIPVILRDLLWLLIHYPSHVREHIQEIDPKIISNDRNILFAIAMLMQGKPVPDILENISDQSLKKLLLHQSMEIELYNNDDVEDALAQIVKRFKVKHLSIQIRQQQNLISELNNSGDVFALIEAMKQQQSLRSEYEKLHNHIQSINSL